MIPYLYLLPCLIFFLIFTYFPFAKTLFISLSRTDMRGEFKSFVGLSNYVELFSSDTFLNMIGVTLFFVLIVVIFSILIGLSLALLADSTIRGSSAFKVIYALPMSVSSACAAIIWMVIFHPTLGILNNLVGKKIGWLIDPDIAIFSVAAVTIWMNIGINFVFLLAGLKNVPAELLESAAIDGARYRHKLFHIILPIISPTMFFMLFINIINAFQAFGQVNILTSGGPGQSTNVFVYAIYREAFFNGRFDVACTESVVLFLIMLAATMIQFRYEKKKVFYQ